MANDACTRPVLFVTTRRSRIAIALCLGLAVLALLQTQASLLFDVARCLQRITTADVITTPSAELASNAGNQRLELDLDGGAAGVSNKDDDDAKIASPTKRTHGAMMTKKVATTTFSSPVCRPTWGNNPSAIRRIFFAHTRKAGGTFLRRLFDRVRQNYNWTLRVTEGRRLVDEVDPRRRRRQDTLYVTVLRHPIQRIISHYKYDGRWDCRQLVRNKTWFHPTASNSRSLEDFIDDSQHLDSTPACHNNTSRSDIGSDDQNRILWNCTELCYLRWFGGNQQCIPNPTQSYETAFQILSQQFHVIVITEWLKFPKYRRGLLEMFGLPVSTGFDRTMYCDRESKYWNRQYPPRLTNDTINRLYQLNHWDVELYQSLATDLCAPGEVVFSPPLHQMLHDQAGHSNATTTLLLGYG